MKYKVEARLENQIVSRRIECADDEEATIEAAFLVLDLAQQHPKSAWALGEVVLTNAEGMPVERMEKKATR